jgi:ATP sulfurylase|tara:strand:- start:248 stop:487 length:240 start_codon:yes stop_codon:yes gene_type:complete
MKESTIVGKFKKVEKQMLAITNVIKRLIQDIGTVESIANGTLSALKISMSEKEWDDIVEELKQKHKKEEKEATDKKLEV